MSDDRQHRIRRSEERRVGKECRSGVWPYQAEDGIRDVAVTGVQTCALPISSLRTYRGPIPVRANAINSSRKIHLGPRRQAVEPLLRCRNCATIEAGWTGGKHERRPAASYS